MAKKQFVLAFFGSEAAADEAVNKIKQWDKASKEVKLGAIGVLVKDDKGKIKTKNWASARQARVQFSAPWPLSSRVVSVYCGARLAAASWAPSSTKGWTVEGRPGQDQW